jgi:hypothetical protein
LRGSRAHGRARHLVSAFAHHSAVVVQPGRGPRARTPCRETPARPRAAGGPRRHRRCLAHAGGDRPLSGRGEARALPVHRQRQSAHPESRHCWPPEDKMPMSHPA